MKNHKLYRFGTVLVLFALLTCLLTVSAFAGEHEEWGYQTLEYQLDPGLSEEEAAAELATAAVSMANRWRCGS